LKLTEKVYLIGGSAYGYSAPGDCNLYIVDCGDSLAMIDSGGGAGVHKVMENIKRMGLDKKNIEVLFATHCHYDHIGGNNELKKRTGCKIAAHEAEVDEIEELGELSLYEMAKLEGLEFKPANVDFRLKDGQILKVGDVDFEIIHTPGHTPGGICLLTEEDNTKNLFSGDTASAQGKLGWVNGPGCDISEWKRSIKKLVKIEPDRMFPGHGVFVLSGATDHLKQLDVNMNTPWTVVVPSG